MRNVKRNREAIEARKKEAERKEKILKKKNKEKGSKTQKQNTQRIVLGFVLAAVFFVPNAVFYFVPNAVFYFVPNAVFYFLPMMFFFVPFVCFFCSICRFLFGPECLFFCSVCVFFFFLFPRPFASFVPFAFFFFCPVAFFFLSRCVFFSATDSHTLSFQWQVCVASPNQGIWFDSLRWHSQFCHACDGASSIPDLRLPKMQADVGMDLQLLCENRTHLRDPGRAAHHVHVIKVCKQPLSLMEFACNGLECAMLPQTEEQGHERISLLSALPFNVLRSSQLIFPDVSGWGSAKTPDEREDPFTIFHPEQTLQHRVSRY